MLSPIEVYWKRRQVFVGPDGSRFRVRAGLIHGLATIMRWGNKTLGRLDEIWDLRVSVGMTDGKVALYRTALDIQDVWPDGVPVVRAAKGGFRQHVSLTGNRDTRGAAEIELAGERVKSWHKYNDLSCLLRGESDGLHARMKMYIGDEVEPGYIEVDYVLPWHRFLFRLAPRIAEDYLMTEDLDYVDFRPQKTRFTKALSNIEFLP